jgi:hypothetical protein
MFISLTFLKLVVFPTASLVSPANGVWGAIKPEVCFWDAVTFPVEISCKDEEAMGTKIYKEEFFVITIVRERSRDRR